MLHSLALSMIITTFIIHHFHNKVYLLPYVPCTNLAYSMKMLSTCLYPVNQISARQKSLNIATSAIMDRQSDRGTVCGEITYIPSVAYETFRQLCTSWTAPLGADMSFRISHFARCFSHCKSRLRTLRRRPLKNLSYVSGLIARNLKILINVDIHFSVGKIILQTI